VHKISKLGAALIAKDITLTIPGKCEIFRNPGSATSHSVIIAALNTKLLTVYSIKKDKEEITF
jgi:hypothetical protein